jgi:hypothetical protein
MAGGSAPSHIIDVACRWSVPGRGTYLVIRDVYVGRDGPFRSHGLDQHPFTADVILVVYRKALCIIGEDHVLRPGNQQSP